MKAIDRWKKISAGEMAIVIIDLELSEKHYLEAKGLPESDRKRWAHLFRDATTILRQIWKEGQR